MPVTYIKEILRGTFVADGTTALLQKRINLKHGHRHELLGVEMFDDQGAMYLTNQGISTGLQGLEVLVTPFPVILTDNGWGIGAGQTFTNMGAFAGDDNVLFKHLTISNAHIDDETSNTGSNSWIEQTFPDYTGRS